MVLIDAVFVNDGGGKVLLDYLILELEKTKNQYLYLLDYRTRDNLPEITSNEIIFCKSFKERNDFYKKNKISFSKVFCFGNIPPNVRLQAKVFTYFHQLLFLKVPKSFSFVEKVKYFLKISVLRYYRLNTDYWLVQSDYIKKELRFKYKLKEEKVIRLPFYPPIKGDYKTYKKVNDSFVYISNATPHKNHFRLVNAFCSFFDEFKTGSLVLTVSDSYIDVKEYVDKKIKEGYPIKNLGFVDRDKLYKVYKENSFLIFPSLAESFGLGIIEAIENGCEVIGADKPYLHEVCVPSIIFDPESEESIYRAFKSSRDKNLKPTSQLIFNEINELVSLLK